MRVHLLGTAAGGGFPQWNCNCANCRVARQNPERARPRTQSCAAFSADGERWFLLNASPDLREQIESFLPLRIAGAVRGSRIEGVLLTGADLDHVLGLFLLREGATLHIHATPNVRRALGDGLGLVPALETFCGIKWHMPPEHLSPLLYPDGRKSGLLIQAFAVPGKPPRYAEAKVEPAPGDNIGYFILDEHTGGRLFYAPDAAALDAQSLLLMENADVLLLDGTFWSEDEMQRSGSGSAKAASMGHLPISGDGGSLVRLTKLQAKRKVYVHINNTNPILLEDSPERTAVKAAGIEVGWDGMEFEI